MHACMSYAYSPMPLPSCVRTSLHGHINEITKNRCNADHFILTLEKPIAGDRNHRNYISAFVFIIAMPTGHVAWSRARGIITIIIRMIAIIVILSFLFHWDIKSTCFIHFYSTGI